MTQLKEDISFKIKVIPDDRLAAIKPLIDMLYRDSIFIEKVDFNDLEDDEKEAVIQGRIDYENGECVDFEDYLKERGIDVD